MTSEERASRVPPALAAGLVVLLLAVVAATAWLLMRRPGGGPGGCDGVPGLPVDARSRWRIGDQQQRILFTAEDGEHFNDKKYFTAEDAEKTQR